MAKRKPSKKEQRFRAIWDEKKYELVTKIRLRTPQKKTFSKRGMDLSELSDIVELPPKEAQKFLISIQKWGANVYIQKNHILAHKSLAITNHTYEDLFDFEKGELWGSSTQMLRFGVVCDTNFGSSRTNVGVLRAAYRHFEREGIRHVVHVGNVLAGKTAKKYAVVDRLPAYDSLEGNLELFAQHYPDHPDITTHFILGHQDCMFESESAIDPGYEIEHMRPNFNYLGILEADLLFNPKGLKPFRVRLYNEKLYYYYGISYQAQKKVENMEDKPDIWLVGGTQQVWSSRYQDVDIQKLPGLQNQTMRMRSRGYLCNVGFSIANIIPTQERPQLTLDTISDLRKHLAYAKSAAEED